MKQAITALAIVLIFLVTPTMQGQEGDYLRAFQEASVRSCPHVQGCSIVDTVQRGEVMIVLHSTKSTYKGGTLWYQVQTADATGWILGALTYVSLAPPTPTPNSIDTAWRDKNWEILIDAMELQEDYTMLECIGHLEAYNNGERRHILRRQLDRAAYNRFCLGQPRSIAYITQADIDVAWKDMDWQMLVDGINISERYAWLYSNNECVGMIDSYIRATNDNDVLRWTKHQARYNEYCRPNQSNQ